MLFVIETMLPDGPHWYAGIRRKQKDGAFVEGPEWSPYWKDRKEFNHAQAHATFQTICKSMEGATVIEVCNAQAKDGWVALDDNSYIMRAKYMSLGMIVIPPGRTAEYVVVSKDSNEFIMVNKMSKSKDQRVRIGIRANTPIMVTGRTDYKLYQSKHAQ